MKTKYIIIGFAALALMSSCSKTRTEAQQPDLPDENAWVNDETLPVPVRFAAPKVMTKAPVTTLENEKVGILGLSYGQGNWTTNSQNTVTLIPNDSGSSTDSYGYTVNAGGEVELNDKYFYPMDNAENFTFFGYYPAKSAWSGWVRVDGDAYKVKFNINGTTDILYARSEAKDYETEDGTVLKGFNGKYIRTINQDGVANEYAPELVFNHILTRIDFSIKAKDAGSGLGIKSLKILNQTTTADLIVAWKSGKEKEGTLAPQGNPGDISVQYQNQSLYDLSLTDQAVALDPVMLIPGQEFTCVLEYANGDKSPEFDVTLPEAEDGKYAGKCYSVTLSVLSPEEVTLKATLIEWGEPIDAGEIEVG